MDEWMRSLKDASDAVRPTGGAAQQITERVERRRRRTAFTTLGAAAAVAAIIGAGISLLPRDGEARPSQTPTSTRTVTNVPQVRVTSCPTESRVFTEHPPYPRLGEQKGIVSSIKMPLWKRFGVVHAAPSALGPVALVRGDLVAARRALTKQGVAIVAPWDPDMAGVGVDAAGQVSQAVQWQLDPIVQEVRRRIRGVPGYTDIGLWESNGAILLSWKKPVPRPVLDLQQVRFRTLGRVIVEGVTYSEADFEAAMMKVTRAGIVRTDGFYFCASDGVMGARIEPKHVGDRKAELERRLTKIAGLPVVVFPQLPTVPWSDRVSTGDPEPPRG